MTGSRPESCSREHPCGGWRPDHGEQRLPLSFGRAHRRGGARRGPGRPGSTDDDRTLDTVSAVVTIGRVNTDHADPADITALRAAFDVESCEPPLGWDVVHAFEAEHGIVLPEPYRTFVAEICDGSRSGPPAFGLVPLADLPEDRGDDRPQRILARPFPLTKTWGWEGDPRPQEEIDPILEQVFDHGSIVLGTDGCGMYWHLVVTGPHRGHVWQISGERAAPFGAEFGLTTGEAGFAGWTGHWAAGKPWFDAA